MRINRKPLFEGEILKIGLFEARPTSDACGEIEQQSQNVLVLPFAGVFAKHDAPGRRVVATPSHAALVTANTSYRLSFPAAIGDRALTLRFDQGLAPEQIDARDGLGPRGLLPGKALLLSHMLRSRLAAGSADPLEVESLGLDLLAAALRSLRISEQSARPATRARHMRAVERVKEAVALAPEDKWTVALLADIAALSPFHLCHVFRQAVGASVYDYVVQERLARSLDPVFDGDDDLTSIALDAGFASHSHFTARFKRFFGCTPSELRRTGEGRGAVEWRKIMTAQKGGPALT